MNTIVNNKERTISVNEQLEATEAYKIVKGFIDAKIKYYNFLYLKDWETDHETEVAFYANKIAQLEEEKEQLKRLIVDANASGKSISLKGYLEVEIND